MGGYGAMRLLLLIPYGLCAAIHDGNYWLLRKLEGYYAS